MNPEFLNAMSEAMGMLNAKKEPTPGEQEVAKEKEEGSKVEYVPCPCCGKMTLVRPVEVKGELLDHYMSCIMSGTPFWHTYKLYGGKLEITISQMSRDDGLKLKTATAEIEGIMHRLDTESQERAKDVIQLARLFACITNIDVHSGGQTKTFHPSIHVYEVLESFDKLQVDLAAGTRSEEDAAQLVKKAYDVMHDTTVMSAVPIRALLLIMESHAQLFDILLSAGFDTTFWDGIELA